MMRGAGGAERPLGLEERPLLDGERLRPRDAPELRDEDDGDEDDDVDQARARAPRPAPAPGSGSGRS